MTDVETTGGILTEDALQDIKANICEVFDCKEDDIYDLYPVQAGMTNIVLSFKVNGGKYIYRHPGLGSDALVSRQRETIVQSVVDRAGIDTTLVAMDAVRGWKITRYIEHRDFNYHDLNDMVRAVMLLKQLHEAPCRVRYYLDVMKRTEEIRREIPPEKYGNFPHFDEIRNRCAILSELSKKDGIHWCNVHGDARDVNFLINKDEIYLIDWEYGGYGDPGFDLGSYIGGGDHSMKEIDRILFTYYRKEPTPVQKRHMYAWIGISGYFYLHWTMLKESKGQKVPGIQELWYRYASEFSRMALDMYTREGKTI